MQNITLQRSFFRFYGLEKAVSTHGLKADACLFGELIFDVNSAYFHNHGGYEYARQFYSNAYQATVDIVGDEQCIFPAVMHADERNRTISDNALKYNP